MRIKQIFGRIRNLLFYVDLCENLCEEKYGIMRTTLSYIDLIDGIKREARRK